MRAGSCGGLCWIAVVVAVVGLSAGCSSTYHPRNITLTFVRHAESESNAAHIVNTSVPGPSLTEAGKKQAQEIARRLSGSRHDGVYASAMVRTQQTAQPFAEKLGRQVQILPGLNEIDAGWFDGIPSKMADSTYRIAPTDWVNGDRDSAIPGSINGNEFNDQFSGAVQKIYDSGDTQPVAFSSGRAIMVWTLMTVKNPDLILLSRHPLPNVGRVVISGNPATGWTLVDWDGIREFNIT